MAHGTEDLVRRGYQAFRQQDPDPLNELFADDLTWKSPGDAPLPGEFHGKAGGHRPVGPHPVTSAWIVQEEQAAWEEFWSD